MKNRIIIGTRGSKLAEAQADWVAEELGRFYKKEILIKKIKTKGDTIGSVWEKGFFVKEIEEELLREEIDIAVHSMKDLPTDLPLGLMIGAVPKRIESRDVLVSKGNLKLDELPSKSLIGTSSLRRKAQILAYRPDLCLQDLRGNLDTRLKRLEEGHLWAIVVAGAGLIRMGWQDRISQVIGADIILPAAGQGALAIEIRVDDRKTKELVEGLNDKDSHVCISAERSFLKTLGGGCQVPIGVLAELFDDDIEISGMTVDGERITRSKIRGERLQAIQLGERLAKRLMGVEK